jgi:hypothetical protein
MLIAAMVCGAVWASAAGQQAKTLPGPQLAGCPVFPADNVWNTPIDKLAVDPHSKDYVASIGGDRGLHPDFGADPGNGIPITAINARTKYIKIDFDYDDSDSGSYPIPPNALVEGGPNAGPDSDRHVILVDKDRCMLAELWAAHRQSETYWKAGSGIKMDLTDNALREDGKTSADAAGLPVLPGLVRYGRWPAARFATRCALPCPRRRRLMCGRRGMRPRRSRTRSFRRWASASGCAPTSTSRATRRPTR